MSEKTEEPTPHKLREARKEGQVARSQDLAMVGSMGAGLLALLASGGHIAERLRAAFSAALKPAGDLSGESANVVLYNAILDMLWQSALALLPVVAAASLGAVIAVAMQVGLQITPKAMLPKFEQVNPAQGLKRVFSMRSLLQLLMMVIKALVVGVVVYQFITSVLPLVSGAIYQSPVSVGIIGWEVIIKMLLFVLGAFLLLAAVDYLIQRKLFIKGQRMSKDEVKREFKGQEGDPEIKGKRRELGMELAQSDSGRSVAQSNVLVVNPTHYAVGIRYREDEAGVPVVLVKGVDDAALYLRGLATQMGVPIFENPPLARALHEVPVDHAVPERLFEAVALVLKWVDEIGQNPAQPENAA